MAFATPSRGEGVWSLWHPQGCRALLGVVIDQRHGDAVADVAFRVVRVLGPEVVGDVLQVRFLRRGQVHEVFQYPAPAGDHGAGVGVLVELAHQGEYGLLQVNALVLEPSGQRLVRAVPRAHGPGFPFHLVPGVLFTDLAELHCIPRC